MIRVTFSRRLRGVVAAALMASAAALAPSLAVPVSAAPAGPTTPVEFQLSRYQPVDPVQFRSVAYADNGRHYLRVGQWMCQFGPQYRYVGCKGKPATAPPGVVGAVISGDQQGPFWVQNRPQINYQPTYRFGPKSGFVPPVLGVGKRVTIGGTTCTVPRAGVVACRTGARAMILTPAWQKFYFPSGDIAHSNNPAPKYLPGRLQFWNQLPADPNLPK